MTCAERSGMVWARHDDVIEPPPIIRSLSLSPRSASSSPPPVQSSSHRPGLVLALKLSTYPFPPHTILSLEYYPIQPAMAASPPPDTYARFSSVPPDLHPARSPSPPSVAPLVPLSPSSSAFIHTSTSVPPASIPPSASSPPGPANDTDNDADAEGDSDPDAPDTSDRAASADLDLDDADVSVQTHAPFPLRFALPPRSPPPPILPPRVLTFPIPLRSRDPPPPLAPLLRFHSMPHSRPPSSPPLSIDALMAPPSQSPDGAIDLETFQQILDLDEDDTFDFSRGMVSAYFTQAAATFTKMDDALCVPFLSLSRPCPCPLPPPF